MADPIKTATNNVSDFADKASSTASGLADNAVKSASDAANRASAFASDAAATVSDRAASAKASGSDALDGFARGVRGVADGLSDQSPEVATLVRTAADGVEQLSNQIRDHDLVDLLNAVTDFTRKRPAIALGCGVLAGVVLTRMLRSRSEA